MSPAEKLQADKEAASARLAASLARMQRMDSDPEFLRNARRLADEDADNLRRQAATDELRYLVGSGIPRKFWPHLDAPEQTKALEAVRGLLDPAGPRLVILGGPVGRGKTTALAYVTHALQGDFLEAQDTARLSMFAAGDWRDMQTTPLLAIDECGKEWLGDLVAANLFSVLNARLQNLRPTALATNLGAVDFAARFLRGPLEPLGDRLRECGLWVSLPGESMRQPAKPWSDTDKEAP